MKNLSLNLPVRYGLSFSLLLVTYINFGWLLAGWHNEWQHWIVVGLLILLLSELLASPWSIIRLVTVRWLKSDRRAFLTALLGGFVGVFLLVHMSLLLNIVLLIAAGLMVRLDLQVANLHDWQAFLLLFSTSLLGIMIGWLCRQYLGFDEQAFTNTLWLWLSG